MLASCQWIGHWALEMSLEERPDCAVRFFVCVCMCVCVCVCVCRSESKSCYQEDNPINEDAACVITHPSSVCVCVCECVCVCVAQNQRAAIRKTTHSMQITLM